MVVGFPTTYAISANPTDGEVYSIQHYVIKFVSDSIIFICYSVKSVLIPLKGEGK